MNHFLGGFGWESRNGPRTGGVFIGHKSHVVFKAANWPNQFAAYARAGVRRLGYSILVEKENHLLRMLLRKLPPRKVVLEVA